MLFRSFVAFCLFTKVKLSKVSVSTALSYLEFLVENEVSVNMVKNHISAIRAMSIVFGLHYKSWDHPRITYFVKALKLHRPMAITKRNIIDVATLKRMVALCQRFPNAEVYKAIFLAAFFGFFRLSNLAPHSIAEFDCTRHFTGGDIFFQHNEVHLLLKWSKTIQFRDECRLVTLPKLGASPICPYGALKTIMALYKPGANSPLFQIRVATGWQVLTDTRVRKNLATINRLLNLPSNYYTFHTFRRSGASLAYDLDIPVKEIKEHGTWASDCVWRYIRPTAAAGKQVSRVFKRTLHVDSQ